MDLRIAVTGLGVCCGIGRDVGELVESLKQARSGLKPYSCPQAPNLTTKYAATIDSLPADKFSTELMQRWDRGTLLAAHAAQEAWQSARLTQGLYQAHRMGLATGASGSGQFQPADHNPLDDSHIDSQISKILLQHNVPGFQTDELARYFGFHGPMITVSSASAGSGIAIGAALRWLQLQQADFVLAGGGEGLLPLNIIGFDFLGILDSQPCSPFSRSHGMSMGEGAAFLALERHESAVARQATIYGYLYGYSVTNDAFDSIQFDPSGDGIRRALVGAMQDARLSPEDIDWIKASGAGGASQDASEIAAIGQAFGKHQPIISSLESSLGHCNGAGPAIGLVAGLACQQQELLPATLNFEPEQSTYDYDFVPNTPRQYAVKHFVATTAAFGGTNVVLAAGSAPPRCTQVVNDDIVNIDDPIVVSGLGLVTALGCGGRELAERLIDDHCPWSDLSRSHTQESAVTQAGIVRGFEARKLLSMFKLRGVELLTQYAAAATKLALQDADLDYRKSGAQMGVVTGIARPSGQSLEKLFQALRGPWGSLAVSKALLRKGRFLVASQLANWFSLKGYTATVTDGMATSLRALSAGINQLRSSPELEALVVVASDEVAASSLRLLEPMGILHQGAAHDWKPYSPTGSGMMVGEGAVALVLERASRACGRGRVPLAEIASHVTNFDAPAIDHSERGLQWMEAEVSGKWLKQAIEDSLDSAHCHASDIDLVLGNGCGYAPYDAREIAAVRQVLGNVHLETVNKSLGVIESASGLASVAAASIRVARSRSKVRQANDMQRGKSKVPAGVLVVGSSEIGRNSAVVIRDFAELSNGVGGTQLRPLVSRPLPQVST